MSSMSAERTTLLLIRHALYDGAGGLLVGRAPGIVLSAEGRRQAQQLAVQLADIPLAAIYASPLERTLETAAPLAARRGLSVTPHSGLNDLDYGAWTGRHIDSLDGDPAWQRWNSVRSCSHIPGGESMAAAQSRALAAVRQIAAHHPGTTVALITHCDIIRALLCHVHRRSLDDLLTFDIPVVSVHAVRASELG